MKEEVLQLCPLPPYLHKALPEHYTVHRWYEVKDQDAWLREHAGTIRAIATGAHLGAPNSLLERLPALGIVAICGVGYDRVDVDFARSRGLHVSYTPNVVTDDVADLTVGLVIALLRNLPASEAWVRTGRWPEGNMPLARKVSGRHFGIWGLGRIGSAIAARLAPFGKVSYTATARKDVPLDYHADALALARACDVLILALAANAATRGIVSRPVLEALGPDGVLVNVGRGSLVDEHALIAALEQKVIAGAALDVFTDEPNVPAALRAMPNVVLTPHIGTATRETREQMSRMVLASLEAFFAGTPMPGRLI
jgi:lactate dehydrogenase-like 2-hydroxyacid dehydrogenase